MKLKISNFAKIEKADINIDGITVICGDNDTGKSTIGKILFSIFSSNYNSAKRIRGEKGLSIINNIDKLQLNPSIVSNFSDFANKCTNEILDTLYLLEFKNLVLYCGKYKKYIAVQIINNAAIYGNKNFNTKLLLFTPVLLLSSINITLTIKLYNYISIKLK